MSSVGVIMPAYNAEATLAAAVARIPWAQLGGLRRLWIIDDGSVDKTAEVARQLASRQPLITLLQQPKNRGYGAALKRGLEACRDAKVSVAACVHADGQYAPELLPGLLDALARRRLDLLQGSRIASGTALSGGMPLYKYLANRVLTTMENATFGLAMTDYHSGYLLYGRSAIDSLPFASFSDSFDFDLEVIASARAWGLRIGEQPIPTHYGDERSHLRSIPYGLRALRVMLNFLTRRYHRASERAGGG